MSCTVTCICDCVLWGGGGGGGVEEGFARGGSVQGGKHSPAGCNLEANSIQSFNTAEVM